MESALEELIYLDHGYALQQSFQGNLCNSSDTGVVKKGLTKNSLTLASVTSTFVNCQLAILANPATASGGSSVRRRVRGTADPVALHRILNHFNGRLQ